MDNRLAARVRLVTATYLDHKVEMRKLTRKELIQKLQESTCERAYDVLFADRYFNAITEAAYQLSEFSFKELYGQVCLNLGATAEQAARGHAPDPYGRCAGTTKDIRGLIRSWVEERSPHSMQHYFCNGKRKRWAPGERPLLFINPGLAAANSKVEWKPYNHVRGTKWSLNKEAATAYIQPSESILNTAESLYKKQGRRGTANQTRMQKDMIVATYII